MFLLVFKNHLPFSAALDLKQEPAPVGPKETFLEQVQHLNFTASFPPCPYGTSRGPWTGKGLR